MPVIAAQSPGDCFYMAIEAVRLATKYMTPVILLTDGYLANGTEPWKIPDESELPKIEVNYHTEKEGFQPFLREEKTLSRPWAIPGTPGLRHRIGGIEKDYNSGNISYDPENHEKMCKVRRDKVLGIANDIPLQEIEEGNDTGTLLVLGWGSTYGAIREAVRRCRARGLSVSHAHVRYISPFPKNFEEVLKRFDKVLVPELNLGQLVSVIRSEYLIEAISYPKIQGQPFKIAELETRIMQTLEA